MNRHYALNKTLDTMKKLFSLPIILLGIGTCLLPFTLAAQSEEGARTKKGPGGGSSENRRAHMQKIDANGDGIITRDEASLAGNPERAERMFDHLDRDGDGAITPEERQAARENFAKGAGKPGKKSKGGSGASCPSCQN